MCDLYDRVMDYPELRKRCIKLNRHRDRAYSYCVVINIRYVCVKLDAIYAHLQSSTLWSYELGHCGLLPTVVMPCVKMACKKVHKKHDVRIHHIASVKVKLVRGDTLAIGGCPELVERYRTVCHPAVCVCEHDRPVGSLCHRHFIDTLLGSNMDVKSGHPSAVFPNGRVSNMRSLFHTIVEVVDDVVWGGLFGRVGISLQLSDNASASANLGETDFWQNCVTIIINTVKCAEPKSLAQTVLHECAHGRVLVDFPLNIGMPAHGDEWLQRMQDIRRLLAPRLTEHSEALCPLTVTGHMHCNDCLFSKDIRRTTDKTVCSHCFSRNVNVTVNENVWVKKKTGS